MSCSISPYWRNIARLRLIALILLIGLLTSPLAGWAKPTQDSSKLYYIPIGPQHTNSLTLIYPEEFTVIGEQVGKWLYGEYSQITQLVGKPKGLKAQVELVEAEQFYRQTQLPRWTNAIYLNSRVIIPVSNTKKLSDAQLQRAIRHELVHAVVDHISKGNCPGWLDEGLAQLIEGAEHPALHKALKKWVVKSGPISFTLLQTGFTKLSRSMVPAAYAQSYYAAATLANDSGFKAYEKLFRLLGKRKPFPSAFHRAFGLSLTNFQREIEDRLEKYSQRSNSPSRRPIFNTIATDNTPLAGVRASRSVRIRPSLKYDDFHSEKQTDQR